MTTPAMLQESRAPAFERVQRPALIAGALALGAALVGAFFDPDQFFRSYLVAYLFWLGMALGCLMLALLVFLAGGTWGAVIRRLLESGAYNMPLMAALFLPLVFGLPAIYLWARPEVVSHDTVLQNQSVYLNVPFFLIRTAFYFALWIALAYLVNRWSKQQDLRGDPEMLQAIRRPSGVALLALFLTLTFAMIDWAMSIEPHWFSTMYPAMVGAGAVLNAFAFVIVVAALLANRAPFNAVLSKKLFNDLGSLLLAFVMIWAYFSFSQFWLIWSGNLKEEIPWYLRRLAGGWEWLALLTTLAQFVLPFALLLFRDLKRNALPLALVAALLIFSRFIDLYWLVTPGIYEAGRPLAFHWLDFATWFALGGIWIAAFVWQLNRRTLLPLNDPRLAALAAEQHAHAEEE